MTPHVTRRRAACLMAAAVLSAPVLALTVSGASADSTPAPTTKAGVEHLERMATVAPGLSKAQVEYTERTAGTAGPHLAVQQQAPEAGGSSDGLAPLWQLAMSAAVGAAVTGAGFAVARQIGPHRRHAAA